MNRQSKFRKIVPTISLVKFSEIHIPRASAQASATCLFFDPVIPLTVTKTYLA